MESAFVSKFMAVALRMCSFCGNYISTSDLQHPTSLARDVVCIKHVEFAWIKSHDDPLLQMLVSPHHSFRSY